MSDVVLNYFGVLDVPDISKNAFRKSIPLSISRREATYPESYVDFIVEKTDSQRLQKSGTLIEEIRRERASADIEKAQIDVADRSADDAVRMVQQLNLNGNPRVMQSSDGVLTIEWHRGDEGVALIFVGDGNAGISTRQNGGLYEDRGREIEITQKLPIEVADMLARLS